MYPLGSQTLIEDVYTLQGYIVITIKLKQALFGDQYSANR